MENTLVLFFAFTMLYMSASSRLKSSINMLSLQGLLLFLIFNKLSENAEIYNYLFLAFETLIIKMLVIPIFIWRVAKKNETFTDTEPSIPRFYSLVIATLILFFGFIFAAISKHHLLVTNPIPFGISISTIMLSLFFITVRKKILTAIIGYTMMENGIFLLSLSIEKEMPLVVNAGVLLDLFVAVFILGFLVHRIDRTFDKDTMDVLVQLKDSDNND